MTDDPSTHPRAPACAPKAGRGARSGWRGARASSKWSLDLEMIGATLEMSVATVRRELDRAIAERRLDAPERYARLQIARLNKALRVADGRLDKGDMRAVAPLLRIVAALDRYHGLAPSRPASETPLPPVALPAPPLALTHAAPPLGGEPLACEEAQNSPDAI
jgi:hypothetical protein